MKKIYLSLLCMLMLSVSAVARAEIPPPDVLIRDTVHDVMELVNTDRGIVANQKRLLGLVEAKILPHFDFDRMTKLAVGRAWRDASDEQKKALTTEFRTMLVRTYTNVFVTYPDPKIEVKPVKLDDSMTEVTVRNLIRISNGQTVTVDYEMEKTPAGWKAFDVTVDGVSLVISYRGSFADQIKQAGVDGLIKTLSDKNLAASRPAAQQKAQSN
ncbi:MAG: ABC transporter substrate-binding protein [Sideroxydans sp.]|nr:ABC transporter substrate-binding protein [Sideroxydans sp.]